ncbi:hypothetical protein [Candidatus Sororendozoicomonas aggregata]|uniref:hypothetical protein n=1 Tax=Candidatus Sororendozoicomonas aggregata TaxID=3073239 RepID=UPI002ED408DB
MNKPLACNKTFPLSNYFKHNNTNGILGSICRDLEKDEFGKRTFSGFVFRGDKRKPELIFREGFIPTGVFEHSTTLDARMDRLTGSLNGGFTFNYGVSTSLSTRIAQFYLKLGSKPLFMKRYYPELDWYLDRRIISGYIYLIDARNMAGYAISAPKAYASSQWLYGNDQDFLREIYEVNFVHAIPNTSIVGAVWSDEHVIDEPCGRSEEWMGCYGIKLTLGENPGYEGDAASVAALFK